MNESAILPAGSYEVERYDSEDAWLAVRRLSIGASEVSIAMGLSPYKSAYALWTEKTGLVPTEKIDNEAMEWGRYLEEPIAVKYAATTGRTLVDHGRHTVLRSTRYPFLTCTLDREIAAVDERGPGALEIKSTGMLKADDWIEEPPLHVQAQHQAQLLVTGWTWGAIAVLVGGQRFRFSPDLPRHEEFLALMVAKCSEFWRRVEQNDPPPVDGSESTQDALKRLYGKDTGEAVALPGEALEWDSQIEQAKKAIRDAEAVKRAAENRLLDAIGSASVGVLPNGGRWSWKEVSRKGYTVEAKTYRQLKRESSK